MMRCEITAGDYQIYMSATGPYSPDVMDDLKARALEALQGAMVINGHADSNQDTPELPEL